MADSEAPTPNRVYVHNLPWSLTNEELANHMSQAGTVRYASIMTTADGRSKGCAIVEYSAPEEAAGARSLSDSELGARKILVREDRGPRAKPEAGAAPEAAAPRRTRGTRGGAAAAGGEPRAPREAREPRAPRAARGARAAAPGGDVAPGTSLYVGNLAWSVSWQDLKDAFASFNPTYADVKMSSDNRSRGWGIVRFATPEEATAAQAGLNNVEVAGRAIQVREDKGPAAREEAPAAAY